MLLKFKKNQIFEAIQAAKLDAQEFDLEDAPTEVRIKHRWSTSYFIIGGDPGHYIGSYVAGDFPAWPYDAYSWEAVMRKIGMWLADVKLDLETPDLWAELQQEAELFGNVTDETNENTPFTPDEQKEIARRLKELTETTKRTYSLSPQQMRVLDTKISYLVNATSRLGRIDWRNAFVGAIIGFILTTALPPETARYIFVSVLREIVYLYGFLPKLPGV